MVAVCWSFRYWKSLPGLNEYEPSAFSVKVPPCEPATGWPTLASLLLTCETLMVSPSGSLSLASTPLLASTVSEVSSSVVFWSSTALGAGFLMSHSKVWLILAPDASVAVTTIV